MTNITIPLGGVTVPTNLGSLAASQTVDLNGQPYSEFYGLLVVNTAITIVNPPGGGASVSFLLQLLQDGTGGRTATFASPVPKSPNGVSLAVAGGPNAISVLSMWRTDGTNWLATPIGLDFH